MVTIDSEILSALRAVNDGVSGADLSQQLGISRAAVWARIEELRAHPQHRARSLWLGDGRPRSLPALVETASLPAGRAPAHGEHGAEVLREAGASDAEISALRVAGVLR